MIKISSPLLLLLLLAVVSGCAREDATTPGAAGSSVDSFAPDSAVASTPGPTYLDTVNQAFRDSSHLPKSGGMVVLVRDVSSAGLKSDPATIDGAYVGENNIRLEVSHGGGCGEHTLALYALEKLEKSGDAVGHLYLSHDAGGDNCEALLRADMTFGLAPLLAYYRDVEKFTGPVRLMIHAPGKKEPSQSVVVEVK